MQAIPTAFCIPLSPVEAPRRKPTMPYPLHVTCDATAGDLPSGPKMKIEEDRMRIAVIGTGGIGAPYGASLARAGADVTFVARGAHLAAIRENGLRIEGDRGETHIRPAHGPTVIVSRSDASARANRSGSSRQFPSGRASPVARLLRTRGGSAGSRRDPAPPGSCCFGASTGRRRAAPPGPAHSFVLTVGGAEGRKSAWRNRPPSIFPFDRAKERPPADLYRYPRVP
jgi:hypothetical protein